MPQIPSSSVSITDRKDEGYAQVPSGHKEEKESLSMTEAIGQGIPGRWQEEHCAQGTKM